MTDPHRYWMDTALVAMGRLRELDSELIVLNKRIKELEAVCVTQLQRIKEFEGKWQETPNSEPVDYMYINWDDSKEFWYMTRAPFSTTRYKVRIVEKF